MKPITHEIAARVLEVVDAGLVSGVGLPTPGMMCVEAAVCFALGEPHGDEPSCVDPVLREFKIALNDAGWSSPQSRAIGLRRLALAQLGSKGEIDPVEFTTRLVLVTINKIVPRALRSAASMKTKHSKALEEAAAECELAENLNDAAVAASYAANAAVDAASYAAYAAVDAASYAAASYAAYAARNAANAASYAAANAASYAAVATTTAAASYAAYAARNAAYAAASNAAQDKELSAGAETAVQILIAMNAPGVQWLDLAPLAE